jgi:hypothetical protein
LTGLLALDPGSSRNSRVISPAHGATTFTSIFRFDPNSTSFVNRMARPQHLVQHFSPLIPMTTVTELKDAGSAAFKEKNYESAISLWSDALSKKGCDVDMERSLLSNRSYAFMHSGNLRAALLDADKCIAVDKSWVKGHLRKAEVCYRMAQFKDSIAAYDAAFKVLQLLTSMHIHTYVHIFFLSLWH